MIIPLLRIIIFFTSFFISFSVAFSSSTSTYSSLGHLLPQVTILIIILGGIFTRVVRVHRIIVSIAAILVVFVFIATAAAIPVPIITRHIPKRRSFELRRTRTRSR